ncbi:PorP/SprF family type IX secretion system membrane protein [Flavobacterium undicola]|uniref:PorP/SprF family type IX secretion system membrane protein n=1 Tax=Flavobacterium undicola TaxID=1932779 RepID=UPI00137772CC|nr:type IX secretion system membrane protein PorP/SprF [Flavobacterium undicola]MBA0883044.1 type IX secretion system membrane protein PorP/SprF [Flavobacterium undicola]
MKKIILSISFLLLIIKVSAQQDPEYTHYMYNMNVVNPAYATGTQAMLDLGVLYRSQWAGLEGAPKTFNFFGHIPLNKKVEMGLSMISDDIGDGAKKEDNFYADFAYVLNMSSTAKLSLGLKAGFTSFKTNFNGFKFESGDSSTDMAFSENVNNIFPNIGVGAYYFTDNYYLGLSAPNLFSSKHIEERSGINAFGSEEIHVFFTGGYVFNLSDSFKLKPAFMTKIVKGSAVSLDLSANVLFNEKFELGASYRFDDAVSALMSVAVSPSIRVGYAYDYTTSNLGQFNSGTHEVFMLFNLDLLGKGYDKSPRFF